MAKKRLQTYLKFIFVSFLVGFTCLFITSIHEIYRPQIHKENAYVTVGEKSVARWLLGNDDEDIHKNHAGLVRKVKTKTIYPITTWLPYKINNPNICRGVEKVSVLVMVHTSPDHFWVRSEMRRTWLNSTHYSPENLRVIFLLGLVSKKVIQLQIEKENAKYGDIIQGNFIDSYRNLTNKGVMGYRWITENCMNAEMVVKVDDDSLINFFMFFEKFKTSMIKRKKYIFCNKIHPGTMPIIRKANSKWFVSQDEYRSFQMYPHTYCSGFVVFISIDLVPSLYHAAIASPFFWVDDFFLFGLLPSRVKNVTFESFGGNLTFMHPIGLKCYKQKKSDCQYLVMPAKKREIPVMWNAVIADRKQSNYGYYYMSLKNN